MINIRKYQKNVLIIKKVGKYEKSEIKMDTNIYGIYISGMYTVVMFFGFFSFIAFIVGIYCIYTIFQNKKRIKSLEILTEILEFIHSDDIKEEVKERIEVLKELDDINSPREINILRKFLL